MLAVAAVAVVVPCPAVVSSIAAAATHPSQMWVPGPAMIFWPWPGTWPQNEHEGARSGLVSLTPPRTPSPSPGPSGAPLLVPDIPPPPGAMAVHPDLLRGRVTS